MTRGEQERARREGRAEPDRTRLSRVVRAASVAAGSEAEFVRRLRRSGVLPRPRYAEGGRDRVVGYSVALWPHGDHEPVWYGGGKLAADLTLPRLRDFWEASPQETAAAVTEWQGTARPPAGAPERATGHPQRWYAAADAVEAAYQALVTVPIEDTAAWAGVAREAAGVLAAWSGRVEPDRPGPLAQAADVLSRSAQTPCRGPHATRAAVPGLRGAAGVVVQAMLARDSAQGWAALLSQLARRAATIARVHEARGERWQAERVAALAAGELRAAGYQDHGDRIGTLRVRELVEVGSRRWAPQRPAPDRPVSPGEHAAAARWHERQQGGDRGFGR